MKLGYTEVAHLKLLGKVTSSMLSSCENDDLASGGLMQQVQQQASFQFFGYWIQRVRHRIGWSVGVYLNGDRVTEDALR